MPELTQDPSARPARGSSVGPLPRSPQLLAAAAVTLVLELAYLAWHPQSPDLAAQLARASAAGRGATIWWTGWFGGINTAPYSVISAATMNAIGVTTLGLLATGVLTLASVDLLRGTVRPRAAAALVAALSCANLFSGRITFAAGLALAVTAVALVQRGRVVGAVLAGALAGLFTALAALGLAIVLTALWSQDRTRTRALVPVAIAALGPVALVAVLLGQPGVMPFSAGMALLTVGICAAVALLPVPGTVRVLAVVAAAVAVVAYAVPSPVGNNATRLPMLVAAPLVLATVRVGPRWCLVLTGALLVWPVGNLVSDLSVSQHDSSAAAFFRPLLAHLPAAGTSTQRVEVLDPRGHGASNYLSRQVPLARGWERQTDVATNALFYDGTLTAASYRTWLDRNAVSLVAVPSGELDTGAQDEGAVVSAHPDYLRVVWSSPDWTLYAVDHPAAMASGAGRVVGISDGSIAVAADRPGVTDLRVTWSRLLVLRSDTVPEQQTCVQELPDGQLRVTIPHAGRWTLAPSLGALLGRCT